MVTHVRRLVLILLTLIPLLGTNALAQDIGDCLSLKPKRPDLGIPIHEQAGVNSWNGQRFAVDAVVRVNEVHASGWLRVSDGETTGWISDRYVDSVVECAAHLGGHSGSGAVLPWQSDGVCRVATWNLEWFKDGKQRGFPELIGSDAIPPRTMDDFAFIADAIISLRLDLVMLQEIHGDDLEVDGEALTESPEMERLVHLLDERSDGNFWQYEIGTSGRDQRLAFLWDTRTVGMRWWCEADLPSERVNGKQLFDRQPIVGMFSCFEDGVEMNDFAVVNLHLASGQRNAKNHDMAMQRVLGWIDTEQALDSCVPSGELDIVIGGDLNMSRFDRFEEDIWDSLESGDWDVLADDETYPGTRLRGDPLGSEVSIIDYLIISQGPGALAGEEVQMTMAHVHQELLMFPGVGDSALRLRQLSSDHLPVTVDIAISADTD